MGLCSDFGNVDCIITNISRITYIYFYRVFVSAVTRCVLKLSQRYVSKPVYLYVCLIGVIGMGCFEF